ncbi:MAG: hypothetical protein GC190_19285 [Alphaproteobacteria bacterium]|nr:hypothetical protein [Alphaproteobacteria bacterium]
MLYLRIAVFAIGAAALAWLAISARQVWDDHLRVPALEKSLSEAKELAEHKQGVIDNIADRATRISALLVEAQKERDRAEAERRALEARLGKASADLREATKHAPIHTDSRCFPRDADRSMWNNRLTTLLGTGNPASN